MARQILRDSAVISSIVAIVNLAIYMVVDPLLRKDAVAKSRESTQFDKGTTRLIGIVFPSSWLLLFLTAVLDQFHLGVVEPHIAFAVAGGSLMAGGFCLRAVAMRTLGKFFTRTLRMREEQHVISHGIYRFVRHPGYLGDILLFGGSAVATANCMTTLIILAVFIPTFVRRIATEERMLAETFGNEYMVYKAKSWRLIPFVF
jgi:protein-S-isoprenylcysteine O-methyltransferase Ste14